MYSDKASFFLKTKHCSTQIKTVWSDSNTEIKLIFSTFWKHGSKAISKLKKKWQINKND